jgi:hypothetical protein
MDACACAQEPPLVLVAAGIVKVVDAAPPAAQVGVGMGVRAVVLAILQAEDIDVKARSQGLLVA